MEFARLDIPPLRLGEGPVWDARRGVVFLCDIDRMRLYAVDPARGATRDWGFEAQVCSIGLCDSGRLLIALARWIVVFDPDSGALERLARLDEPARHRFNDGKTGPDGRFYVGTMDQGPERGPNAALYRFDPADGLTRVKTGIIVTNGLAWSPDGRVMIHTDSAGPWIDRHDFDPAAGAVGPARRIAAPGEAMGRPDGGACDAGGRYWSAGVSAGRLNVYDLDGALLEHHPTPCAAPTMPCFCGPDLRTVLVTSHQITARPGDATAGGVYAARAPVAGAEVARIKGL